MPIVVPVWLLSSQPPLRQWLGLVTRMVLGAFITAAIVVLIGIPMEPAAWSVTAVVVVLGFTAGASLSSGINRMQGSVVGCVTGGVSQFLLGGWLWLPIVAAVSVAVSVTICRLLRIGAGFRLGGALAAFFVFVPGAQEWETVGWRLAATLIGITVAMVIALLLWPVRADASVRKGIATPIRDSVVVVEAAMARWTGAPEPTGLAAARTDLSRGTAAVATALTDRTHERAGAWEPTTYSILLGNLNEAMRSAQRMDRVAGHREGDQLFVHVAQRFADSVAASNALALTVADELDAGDRVDRVALAQRAAELDETPMQITTAIEDMRAKKVTFTASAEELQRLFSIALLVEHWAESVQGLANTLAEA